MWLCKVNGKLLELESIGFKNGLKRLTLTIMSYWSFFLILLLGGGLTAPTAAEEAAFEVYGPAYSEYRLTLHPGEGRQALGPILGWENTDSGNLFRVSPFFSLYRNPNIPQAELEVLYPLLTLDRFGPEYRLQLLQVIAFAGGERSDGPGARRFTLFPIYFQQRSANPELNYTAVVPFYGRLKNRLFRDEIFFVMLPLYLQTVKREVVTDNYLFPIFHLRHGPGLEGWQVWPLIGREHKEVTSRTNNWGDVVVVPGHDKFSLLWPIYFNNTLGIGTTNLQEQLLVLPFYASQVSSNRVVKNYGWPIGYTHIIDRDRKYEEWGFPWPLVVFARGEGKTVNRLWPLFGRAKNPILQSDFYLWPIYKYNRATAPPLDRERTRILLFLYSDLIERDMTNNTALHRVDLWPLFTWRKDHQDRQRLQVLAPLEPLLPHNKSIERLYSPLWSVYTQEENPETGASSKSLLWNLFRCEHRPGSRKHSFLFGLFQHEKIEGKTRWRVFYIPFGRGTKDEADAAE